MVATYSIRNVGGEDLVLAGATATCGCSKPSLQPNRVPPGAAATLTVEGTPLAAGTRHVMLHVQSNDPQQRDLQMRFTMVGSGTIPYVGSAVDAVAFGVVTSQAPRETCYVETREAQGSRPWLINPRVSLAEAAVKGEISEERSLGGGVLFRRYEFAVELINNLPVGDFRGELTFESSIPSIPVSLRIPVHGIVRPAVFAVPSNLYASCVRGERPAKLRFSLTASDPATRLQVDWQSDGGNLLSVRQVAASGPRVMFEVDAERSIEENLTTELVFRTNLAEAPEIKVPVVFIAAAH